MLLSPTVEQIAEVTNGEILSGNSQTECHSVSTDTRTLTAGSLYIPLVGERFDGHEFVSQATDAGAVAVLTERPLETEITQIKVDDTLRALADLAAWHRDQFSGRVVAVTGSAGKTTVKQLMGSVLAQRYETLITDFDVEIVLAVIIEEQRFSAAFAFIVARARADRIDVAPIAFRLWVNAWVAINF